MYGRSCGFIFMVMIKSKEGISIRQFMENNLPTILPVFRVRSTILMPNVQLPITMSENDYYSISSELVENNIIGIVQPKPIFFKNSKNKEKRSFSAGCAGRISDINFSDGGITINIFGICRFEVLEDLSPDNLGIERVSVSYEKFASDLDQNTLSEDFDKDRLMHALDQYFKTLEIAPNWQEIEKTPVNVLISALAMACPLHPSEKQSLLETVDINERSLLITRFIEMNSFDKYNTANTIN